MDELKNAIATAERAKAAYDAAVGGRSAMEDYAQWRIARRAADKALTDIVTAAGGHVRADGPVATFQLAGIRSTSTGGELGALGNWLRAATAKLAKMEAGHG